jgi:hypothetical protein
MASQFFNGVRDAAHRIDSALMCRAPVARNSFYAQALIER